VRRRIENDLRACVSAEAAILGPACFGGIGLLLGVVPLPARGIGLREYSIVNRAGLSNQTGPLELRFRDKLYDVTHLRSKLRSRPLAVGDANAMPTVPLRSETSGGSPGFPIKIW
jgi:hypothetical protein